RQWDSTSAACRVRAPNCARPIIGSARLLRRPPQGAAARAGGASRPGRRGVLARGQDDLVLIVRRIEALGKFLDSEDGQNRLAGSKRAANILRIEEKRDGTTFTGAPDPQLYAQTEERGLAQAIDITKKEASAAVAGEDFAAAMRAMAKLRPHVDAFFDKVTV